MKKIIYLFSVGLIATSLFSCKKYLDVNQNPNYPEDVSVAELLPAAQASIGQSYGNYFQILGGFWSQYWTQNPSSSQYRSYDQYQLDPADPDNAWIELYGGALKDLDQIIKKSDTGSGNRNYRAIAMILQGYTYQLLTDNFGDIPFSEALRAEEGITSPKYDSQEQVYAGIIAMVREGRDLLTDERAHPGSDDLIYGGDLEMWYRFANTLLLRCYMRLSEVNPTLAQQGIAALDGEIFIEEGMTAQITYHNTPGSYNPFYSEMVGLNRTQNAVASETGMDALLNRVDTNGNPDPRIDAFYYYNNTNYAALLQGFYSTTTPTAYSLPGFYVGGVANPPDDESIEITASAPVKLLSSYESLFLQAEAAARGWLTGNAQELYERAIMTNFDEYGLLNDFNDYVDYYLTDISPYPAGGSLQDQVEAIITEKWVAMNGNQNIEAWTEWRRTGYPDFFTVSVNTRIGNNFPQRVPYPEREITTNLKFPGQKTTLDRVWWDTH